MISRKVQRIDGQFDYTRQPLCPKFNRACVKTRPARPRGLCSQFVKDIPALKQISQKFEHANFSVTDGVYGILSSLDVKEEISKLGKNIQPHKADEIREFKNLINLLMLKLADSKLT